VSKRGEANLQRFNDERSRLILPMITDELIRCAKRRVQFKSVGLLAAFLGDVCRVNRTTLLRNPMYKSLLYDYMARQAGAATVVGDETESVPILKAKLAIAQAENGSLRTALARASKLAAKVPAEDSGGGDDVDLANALVLLCLILGRVTTLAVDRQSRSIVDLAARPSDRVIAGPSRASAFVDWLDRHRALPDVANVRVDR
jgi:hypothetical protein